MKKKKREGEVTILIYHPFLIRIDSIVSPTDILRRRKKGIHLQVEYIDSLITR